MKLVHILQKENVSFTQDDVIFMVNAYYPDIRKIINFAQQSAIETTDEAGVPSLKIKISKENAVETDLLNKLTDLLKNPQQPVCLTNSKSQQNWIHRLWKPLFITFLTRSMIMPKGRSVNYI